MHYQGIKGTYRGHITAFVGLFMLLCTLLLQSFSVSNSYAFGAGPIIDLSSSYRVNSGLYEYIVNQQLMNSAQAKADDMASKGYFAHDSPDGKSPWDFISFTGYAYESAGENLAITNQSPSDVVEGWYQSPGHKANLLNSIFSEVGYGVSYLPSFTYNGETISDVWFVAAHYAKPVAVITAAPTSEPPVTNPVSSASPSFQPASPKTLALTQPEPETTNNTPVQESAEIASTHSVVDIAPTQKLNINNTPTPYNNIIDKPPVFSPALISAIVLIGFSLSLLGAAVEIRRVIRHKPLIFWHPA